MKTGILTILALLIMALSSFAGQPVKDQVRDSQGKLIGTTTTRGNVTEGRNATGKLEYKARTDSHGVTTYRDATGKALFKTKK
jgi:hypothetical protein